MKPDPLPSSEPAALLDALRSVPPRSAEDAARGRVRFLEQAQALKSSRPAVSAAPKARHKGWNIFPFWRKERLNMTTLTTMILIVSLLFGGAGATVYAAQDSQPDQPLYQLKLASEDARFELSVQSQTRLELALEFADRRVEEVATRVRAEQDIPAGLAARWQAQIETALTLAAGADDAELPGQLDQVRLRLQDQARLLDSLSGAGPAEAQLDRLREQLHTCLRLVEDGQSDPAVFRNQVRAGNYLTQPDAEPGNPWVEGTPTPGSGYGPGPGDCDDCTPQGTAAQQGGNPWVEGTPTPGSGYGPGPGDCDDCTPQGTAAQQGGNPWVEDTPTPGSGYGPGPAATQAPDDPQPTAQQNGGGGDDKGGGSDDGGSENENGNDNGNGSGGGGKP